MSSLGWLAKSHILNGCTVLDTMDKIGPTGNYKYFFNDMGFLSYMYMGFMDIPESDIKGILAENFVYLFIRDNFTNLNEQSFIDMLSFYTFNSDKNEIDFLVRKNNKQIGIEVKYKKGVIKSADEFLSQGKIDWVVKIMKTFGGVGSKKTVIPIFAIDKMFLYPPFI